MRYIEAQFKMFEMQAMFRHAEIVSGAYKFRMVSIGINKDQESQDAAWDLIIKNGLTYSTNLNPYDKKFSGEGRPKELLRYRECTEEEKLQDSLQIMQRQIEFMNECLDHWDEKE